MTNSESSVRNQSGSDYCEFIVRERGVGPLPHCTVEVRNTFNQEFGQALMKELPRGAWLYDSSATPRVFRIHPAEIERAAEIAKRFYGDHVYRVEGETRTNIATGESISQGGLF